MTDAELAERAAAGDPAAFGELVERYAPVARRLARGLLTEPADADDAVQDGFASAWRSIALFDPRRPFRPWLLKVVLNSARDFQRRRRVRQTTPLSGQEPAGGGGPDRDAGRALLRAQLRKALAALPERQRIAVTLFDAEGYGHGEIATLLGIPEGTVRSDVFHARRALRQSLAAFRGEAG